MTIHRIRLSFIFAIYFLTMPARKPSLAAQIEARTSTQGRVKDRAKQPLGIRYTYKIEGGQQLALFVLSPPTSPQKGAHPALLFFHGGGFIGGPLNQFDRQAQYLAGRGVVAIQVQYRLEHAAGTDPITPSIQDAMSAIRWVRAHSSTLDVNPDRIGVVGGSAGGNLAAFLGMADGLDSPGDNLPVSSHADIMVLFNPVLDMGSGACCTKHAGADYKAISPIYFVRPGLPPTLILQGEGDKTVSPTMIANFAASMKRAGNDCTLDLYPNVGHGFFNVGENFYKTLEQIDVFLAAHGWLKGTPDVQAIRNLSLSLK